MRKSAEPCFFVVRVRPNRFGETLEGRLRLPPGLNPAGARQLPALADRSFHQLWAEGEVTDDNSP